MEQTMRLRGWAVLWVWVLISACGGGGDGGSGGGGGGGGGPVVASVSVSATSATIEVAGTVTLTAVAHDAAGNVLSGISFTWSSSDAAVATVTNGVVTGIAGGTAAITASAGTVHSPNTALTVRQPPAAGVSSDALIDQALAAGTIDAETALTYHVFAAFRDARLPDAYRGADSEGFESDIVAIVLERFSTLSATTQAKLAPYLERPASIGSWLDPAVTTGAAAERQHALASRGACQGILGTWRAIDPPNAKVRVWYDSAANGHIDAAAKVANYMEADVWPRLITALGFKEPADDTSTAFCDGGNAKLDIYLVDATRMSNRGETHPDFFSLYTSAVYILINAALPDDQLQHTTSHEFMHAIHWAYTTRSTQKSYGWFRDALANWATDEVYPGNPSLNRLASCHFKSPQLSLDDQAAGYCTGNSQAKRDYGGYLPLRHLSKNIDPTIVRRILAATETYGTALEAMDNTLSDGLAKHWPLFGRALWNQDAVKALYSPNTFDDWEKYAASGTAVHTPVLAPDIPNLLSTDFPAGPSAEFRLDARLNNMSNKFYHFSFASEHSRSVMFHNTFYDNRKANQAVTVYAFFKPEGQPWQEEDWTDYEWIGFCRDFKLQRLEQLVIVLSSAEWRGSNPVVVASKEPRLMRNNVGCWAYTGTAKRTLKHSTWTGNSVATFNAQFDYHPGGVPNQYTDRPTGRLRVPLAAPLFLGGTWTLVENYGDGGCHYTINAAGSSSSILLGGDSAGTIVVNTFNESLPTDLRLEQESLVGAAERAYLANGVTDKLVNGVVSGTDCGATYQAEIGGWLLTRASAGQSKVVADDDRMTGTFDASESGDTEIYEWNFTPQRQP